MIDSLLYLTATREHSIRRGAVRALSDFPTLLTSDDSSADFQVSQTHF
jgi:hypothetical protein